MRGYGFPYELPIDAREEDFLSLVRSNQVVILRGELGSGKTTRAPIMLYLAGYGELGIIGVTEPRRIAAVSAAEYMKVLLPGEEDRVGYKVRFADTTDKHTRIKMLTDGMLLQELRGDRLLSKYSVIMIDEAHERNQNMDYLFGLLKREILPKRPDLRVIISSATIDVGKFSRFFGDAPVIEVSGRVWPVKRVFLESEVSHIGEALSDAMLNVHRTGESGGMLAFVPGKRNIASVSRDLRGAKPEDMEILHAYGDMKLAEQQLIFEDYPGMRKVVVATPVAESSLTIPGLRYVFDSGLVKEVRFNPETGIQSLVVCEASHSSSDQRMGRAGRVEDGICLCMYTEENYKARCPYAIPEICRMGVANVILSMLLIGISDIENFPFMDPPDPVVRNEGHKLLRSLGATTSDGKITELGRRMAILPLEPSKSYMLLEADKRKCVNEMVTIAAFDSVHVFLEPPELLMIAEKAHKKFRDADSDAVTYLNVWNAAVAHEFDPAWCDENFLSLEDLLEAQNIRNELLEILQDFGIELSSAKKMETVKKTVAAGLIRNLLHADERGWSYALANSDVDCGQVFIHPGSSVHAARPSPEYIVAGEIFATTKTWASMCEVVPPEWLPELLPEKFSFGKVTGAKRRGNAVLGTLPVLYKNKRGGYETVGFGEKAISPDEARELQCENTRNAEASGLKEVTLQKKAGRSNALVAYYGSDSHDISGHSSENVNIKEGGHYYARLWKEKVRGRMEYFAELYFQVHDFGEQKERKEKRRSRR